MHFIASTTPLIARDQLSDEIVKGINDLQNPFKLPDECKELCNSLQRWREEIEALSSRRSPADRRLLDVGRNAKKSMALQRSTNIHIVGAKGALVDWFGLSKSCHTLATSLNSFSYAIYFVSELHVLRCNDVIRELVQTLLEISTITHDEMQFNVKRSAKITDKDLRNFVRCRFEVCEKQLATLKDAIQDYSSHELGNVMKKQKLDFEKLANVTTVSTFFAAVVVSSLQISLSGNMQMPSNEQMPINVIDAFWLGSLILSIGSALNSFLAATILKVILSTPMSQQPHLVSFWIRHSHSVLLVFAVFCYSVGLGIFVFKTQPKLIKATSTFIGAVCAVGLATIAFSYTVNIFNRRTLKSEPEPLAHLSPLGYGGINAEEMGRSGTDLEDGLGGESQANSLADEVEIVTLKEPPELTPQIGDVPRILWNWQWLVLVRAREYISELYRRARECISNLHRRARDSQQDPPPASGNNNRNRTRNRKPLAQAAQDEVHSSKSALPQAQPGAGDYEENLGKVRLLESATLDLGEKFKFLFEHGLGAEILHWRISPSGRWLVICHVGACIVYDIKQQLRSVVLGTNTDHDLRNRELEVAAHAAWAPKDDTILLTRTSKRIRLWKIVELLDGGGLAVSANVTHQYSFGTEYSLNGAVFRYARWLDGTEFIVLDNNGVFYCVVRMSVLFWSY